MNEQTSLFSPLGPTRTETPVLPAGPRYPWHPGAQATDTSHAAAEAILPVVETLRRAVLECYQAHPEGLTADECAALLGRDKLAIRPRVTELQCAGYLRDTGERRANVSGKSAMVWVA